MVLVSDSAPFIFAQPIPDHLPPCSSILLRLLPVAPLPSLVAALGAFGKISAVALAGLALLGALSALKARWTPSPAIGLSERQKALLGLGRAAKSSVKEEAKTNRDTGGVPSFEQHHVAVTPPLVRGDEEVGTTGQLSR